MTVKAAIRVLQRLVDLGHGEAEVVWPLQQAWSGLSEAPSLPTVMVVLVDP